MAAGSRRRRDILLCDLDAFFAAVEQRENPAYRGKPVIVGGSPQDRGVVSTCSYEARQYGVHSAMAMARAVKLCPEAIILPVNFPLYRAVSEEIMMLFERFTPEIEAVSIDEAYLAVPRGTGMAAAENIRSAVRAEQGLSISVGVSANKLLAKIACNRAKPDGVKALWPEDVAAELWPLPLKVLPGLGPVSVQRMNGIGIRTIGDLANADPARLERLMGKTAPVLQQYARGIDDRPLEPVREAKSLSEERTFPEDVTAREAILTALLEQAESLGYRLRSLGLRARTIGIKLRLADFSTITRDQTLGEATDLDSVIYRVSRELFERCGARPPWRLAGIRLSNLETCRQLSLFDPLPAEAREHELSLVRDRLRRKYGADVLYRAGRLTRRGRHDRRKPPR